MGISYKPGPDDGSRPAGSAWSLIGAVAVATFYLASSIYLASGRPFWLDEMETVLFAGLPKAVTIWKAVSRVDPWGEPTPYYLVVHVFLRLLGPAEVAARLPSALALAAGLLVTFDCTRRLAGGLNGLAAVALITCTSLPYFGFEARCYGIYFMLAAMSLWMWVHTSRASRSSAVIFGTTIFLAAMMHPYAVLCLVPYAIWDLSLWRPWRLPSAKIIAGALAVACAGAVLWTQAMAATGKKFWKPSPSLSDLREAYTATFPGGLLLLVLAIVWIAFAKIWIARVEKKGRAIPVLPMGPAESVGWLFMLLPIAGYLLARFATHAFLPRYFLGMLPGVAVAFGCLLWRYFRETPLVVGGIVVLLLLVGIKRELSIVRHPESYYSYYREWPTAKQILGSEATMRADGKQFILVTQPNAFLEIQYYSKHPWDYRLLVTGETPGAFLIAEYYPEYYPWKRWRLEDLKAHARDTAVILPDEVTLNAMKQAGYVANTRFSGSGAFSVVYFQ
jgi:hypothetical protein